MGYKVKPLFKEDKIHLNLLISFRNAFNYFSYIVYFSTPKCISNLVLQK